MAIDVEQRGAVVFRVDDVRIPQLVVEGLWHGYAGWLYDGSTVVDYATVSGSAHPLREKTLKKQ
jgi:hypothetical protein